MIDPRSLARLSGAQSRSISPENFDGAKGGGAPPPPLPSADDLEVGGEPVEPPT
jgi:hypothetical protein